MARDRTGFTDEQREIILRRSYGTCEVCNNRPVAHLHHRRPRRMGGARGASDALVNAVANALALCNICHDRTEAERSASRTLGRLVAADDDPARTPVFLPRYRGWVLLDADGDVHWHQSYEHALAAGDAAD